MLIKDVHLFFWTEKYIYYLHTHTHTNTYNPYPFVKVYDDASVIRYIQLFALWQENQTLVGYVAVISKNKLFSASVNKSSGWSLSFFFLFSVFSSLSCSFKFRNYIIFYCFAHSSLNSFIIYFFDLNLSFNMTAIKI